MANKPDSDRIQSSYESILSKWDSGIQMTFETLVEKSFGTGLSKLVIAELLDRVPIESLLIAWNVLRKP